MHFSMGSFSVTDLISFSGFRNTWVINFLNEHWLFQLVKAFVHFMKVVKFIGIKLFIRFLGYVSSLFCCGLSSTPDICKLCNLFPLLCLARGLSILLNLKETASAFIGSCIAFLLSVLLISIIYFLTSVRFGFNWLLF